jgi:hypothetical protein
VYIRSRFALWWAALPLLSCDSSSGIDPRADPVTGYYVVVPTNISAVGHFEIHFNDRGDILFNDVSGVYRYASGTLQVLETVAGASQTVGRAMNQAGDVAGDATVPGANPKVLKWLAGSTTPIEMPPIPAELPFAALARSADINDTEDVLIDGLASSRDTAFLIWSRDGFVPLVTDAFSQFNNERKVYAHTFNNSRDILAWSSLGTSSDAFLLDAQLGLIPGTNCPPKGAGAQAVAPLILNEAGTFVVAHRGQHCLLRPGQPMLVLPFGVSGLNNNGWLVGAFAADGPSIPVVSMGDTTFVPADRLFATDSDREGWLLESFVRINDNNEILAIGNKGGARQFLILKPRAIME